MRDRNGGTLADGPARPNGLVLGIAANLSPNPWQTRFYQHTQSLPDVSPQRKSFFCEQHSRR
jgi:hypothetical protein